MRARLLLVTFVAALILAACGTAGPAAQSTAAPAAQPTSAPQAPTTAAAQPTSAPQAPTTAAAEPTAAGAQATSAPAASGETIKIGGGFALTGDESALDLPAANGA